MCIWTCIVYLYMCHSKRKLEIERLEILKEQSSNALYSDILQPEIRLFSSHQDPGCLL